MLETLKAFWQVLTTDDDRTWFPHEDGKRLCRWSLIRHEFEFKPMPRKRTGVVERPAAFREIKY